MVTSQNRRLRDVKLDNPKPSDRRAVNWRLAKIEDPEFGPEIFKLMTIPKKLNILSLLNVGTCPENYIDNRMF